MSDLSSWAAGQLHALGWIEQARVAFADFLAALHAYQEWHGLDPTDELDGPTRRSLAEPRFCAYPDRMDLAGETPRWPMARLTWTIDGQPLPGLSVSEYRDAAAMAWASWMAVAGIRLDYSQNAKTANILMGSGRIDGPLGTLAWSELPSASRSQLQQKYDTSEAWAVYEGAIRRKEIDPVRVIAHEGGHALGLGHGPAGCLMAPTISEIRGPREWDIAEMERRYPREQPPTTPLPPPAPPTGEGVLRIQIRGLVEDIVIPGYRVTKLGA